MADPFLAELKIIAWNYPPKGWAFCNGQILAINQNQALFSLLGTTYGGNGQTNFALPNLQGRVPIHVGNGFTLGQIGGETAHTLTLNELPTHTHALLAGSGRATSTSPNSNLLARTAEQSYSGGLNQSGAMDAGSIANVGGGQPHPNLSPILVLNVVIALVGIFPGRS